MIRLYEFGAAWRDYLYANHEGKHNDIEGFLIIIELIHEIQEGILEIMLRDEQDMELVKLNIKDIMFYKEHIKYLVNEFADYYTEKCNIPARQDPKAIADDILNDLGLATTDSYLYKIAKDWKEWGAKAKRVCNKLNDSYGNGLYYLHNDLCRLIMEEVYGNHDKRNEDDWAV